MATRPSSESPPDGEVHVRLVEGTGTFKARAEWGIEEPWLQVSIPVPYRGQTPVEIQVFTEPPEQVRGMQVISEGENRYLRLHLKAMRAGKTTKVAVRTLVLLRKSHPPSAVGVQIPPVADVPAEMRVYLEPAEGIEATDASIQKIASGLPREDLAGLARSVHAFLYHTIAGSSGPQGALDVLERKGAACTGRANLAAALLIASGAPARILPCIMLGGVQQEHYIVETWAPEVGWLKMEPGIGSFPFDDLHHLVLRFAGPDARRSAYSVPLYEPIGSGVVGGYDCILSDYCFQSAEVLARWSMPVSELNQIEMLGRKAFLQLEYEGHPGDRVQLGPDFSGGK